MVYFLCNEENHPDIADCEMSSHLPDFAAGAAVIGLMEVLASFSAEEIVSEMHWVW